MNMEGKTPIKELPKCFGDPEVECIYHCAIEQVCANTWLERQERAKLNRRLEAGMTVKEATNNDKATEGKL